MSARPSVIEFVALPDFGRRYSGEFRVRLGDADASGILRLDGVARVLQDVATDDWEDTGLESTDTWVVRRTTIRVAEGGRWPRYKEVLTVTTWCGGTGAAWAERRTNISAKGQLLVEAVALWVPVDPSGHPVRIKPAFFDVYGEAMQGRKVSGRIATPEVADDAEILEWPLRRADLDIGPYGFPTGDASTSDAGSMNHVGLEAASGDGSLSFGTYQRRSRWSQ